MGNHSFKPAWWLKNSHLQTIWPSICKREIKNLVLRRERVELPDGDFIDLDWLNEKQSGPLVLILHGFEGSIESHYAKTILQKISLEGWRGVFMHFRGCSGEPNRLARGYHSGETEDVAYIVQMIRQRPGNEFMAAIGYSLGGNVLLKWLGETAEKNPLKVAIAVSVPFELHKASSRIQHGFSRFYQWYFLRCVRDRLLRKFKSVPPPFDPEDLLNVHTLRDLDEEYTAPLHGFNSADEYYTHASSRQFLRYIQVPTLILHAKDDPFMTTDAIPSREELSSSVELEVSPYGGHVGFVYGTVPWRPQYWLEERIPLFLREHFNRQA